VNKSNVILGINWELNSTVALYIDNEIVECVSEERFSRGKNDERYPFNAINYILKKYNLDIIQITKVSVISKVWSPVYTLLRHYSKFTIKDYIKEQTDVWYPAIYQSRKIDFLTTFEKYLDKEQYPGKIFWESVIQNLNDQHSSKISSSEGQLIRSKVIQEHLGIDETKIEFVDHHLGHAAYGYFASKLKGLKTLVVTLDAFGDGKNYSAWLAERNSDNSVNFKLLIHGDNFIGARLYRYVTLILGMKPNEHEYKVMGLAPYSKNEFSEQVCEIFDSYQNVNELEFQNLKFPKDLYFAVKQDLDGKRFDAIAGGLQMYIEKIVLSWIKNLIEATGVDSLVLSGGVAMNVKLNGEISKISQLKQVCVPPSPDDSSQAMGACYASIHNYKSESNQTYLFKSGIKPIKNAYLGFENDESGLKNILKIAAKNGYRIEDDPNKYSSICAQYLADGKIIGRIYGRSEFGARALGNRSILANPSNPDVIKVINETIKNRDFWMPFAASILSEYASEYLQLDVDQASYNYMTNSCRTTKVGSKKLAAAIHPYDLSCRPQIVNKDDAEISEFHKLISKFGHLTETYALLNTSFNLHGSPIVNTYQEGYDIFVDSNLSAIIVDNCIILKE
jgi:carbamoyltransferase